MHTVMIVEDEPIIRDAVAQERGKTSKHGDRG